MDRRTYLVVDVVVVVHLEVFDPLHPPALHDIRGHLVHFLPLRFSFRVAHLTKCLYHETRITNFAVSSSTVKLLQSVELRGYARVAKLKKNKQAPHKGGGGRERN